MTCNHPVAGSSPVSGIGVRSMFDKLNEGQLRKYDYIFINDERELKTLTKSKKKQYFIIKCPYKKGKAINTADFELNMVRTYGIYSIGHLEMKEDEKNMWFLFRTARMDLKYLRDRGILI